jgi:ABC-type uncharacterized transport system fused permease/ATPase subunit
MPDIYIASNWYWKIKGKSGQVFSSAKPGYISENNQTYKNWLKAGNYPSGGDYMTDGELADVLLKAGLPNEIIAASGAADFGEFLSDSEKQAVLAAVGQVNQ